MHGVKAFPVNSSVTATGWSSWATRCIPSNQSQMAVPPLAWKLTVVWSAERTRSV